MTIITKRPSTRELFKQIIHTTKYYRVLIIMKQRSKISKRKTPTKNYRTIHIILF